MKSILLTAALLLTGSAVVADANHAPLYYDVIPINSYDAFYIAELLQGQGIIPVSPNYVYGPTAFSPLSAPSVAVVNNGYRGLNNFQNNSPAPPVFRSQRRSPSQDSGYTAATSVGTVLSTEAASQALGNTTPNNP